MEDTQGQESDGAAGRGLSAEAGATIEVVRALISRNRQLGVFAHGDGTSVALADVVVADTQGLVSNGKNGLGLAVQGGATATVSRALFARNRQVGFSALGRGTSVTLTDVVIRDTELSADVDPGGIGLSVHSGAVADVTRLVLSGNPIVGVLGDGEGASLTLSDIVVADSQSRALDGAFGRGLNVQFGATATVDRGIISRSRAFGVIVGWAARVELSDVVVTETADHACSTATCPEPVGVGLASVLGGSLRASNFEVQDSELCGVLVAESGQLDLTVGEVSGSQIGVCLQVPGYSISRLTERVRYLNNGTNLDTTSLPVPDPTAPIGEVE